MAVVHAGRHGMAWPCRSCRARTSRAWASLGVVVHHLMLGAYEHDQGTKGNQCDMVAGFGGERREGRVNMWNMAGMALPWLGVASI